MKIYYTSEGWVCNMHPYNIPIESEDLCVDVDEETAMKIGCVGGYNNWKYVNGEFVEELYDAEGKEKADNQLKIWILQDKLAETDYKVTKYMEGLIPEEEWEIIKSQRQAWRDEINRLENIINDNT